MKNNKISVAISILVCLLSLNVSARDEGEVGKQLTSKKTKKAAKNSKDRLSFESKLSLGSDNNVFKTPSSSYVDPTTGLTTKNNPTSGFFFNPDLTLSYTLIHNDKNKLAVEYNFDGVFYGGNAKVSNASGNDQMFKIDSKVDFINYKESSGLQRVQLNSDIYQSFHNYSYFHRGTGDKRVTITSSTNQEDRYAHNETGLGIEPEISFSTGTKTSVSLKYFKRDYEDITGLQSFDRSGLVYGLNLSQKIRNDWAVRLTYESEAVKYDRYKASNVTGSTVNGTIRKYQDDELGLKFNYDTDGFFGSLGYKKLERDDKYAGYWSYDQDKTSLDLGYNVSKNSNVSVGVTTTRRDYEHETNSLGNIRSRETQVYDLSLEKEEKWGKVSLNFDYTSQSDTDPYYSYRKIVAMLGYEREF